MNPLPNDPVMLLSMVNTELRDRFPTLERFCAAHQIDQDALTEKLEAIDYFYDSEANQFL